MSKKIIICDDEEGIRESLKLILADHYSLILVDGAEQCVETLASAKDVGMIFMDIKMRANSGFDALKEIKSKYPWIKVIMTTGYQSVETAAEASRLGASGYIIKPFKSEEILAAAKKHLP